MSNTFECSFTTHHEDTSYDRTKSATLASLDTLCLHTVVLWLQQPVRPRAPWQSHSELRHARHTKSCTTKSTLATTTYKCAKNLVQASVHSFCVVQHSHFTFQVAHLGVFSLLAKKARRCILIPPGTSGIQQTCMLDSPSVEFCMSTPTSSSTLSHKLMIQRNRDECTN